MLESPLEGPSSQSYRGEIWSSHASVLQRYSQTIEIGFWLMKFVSFSHENAFISSIPNGRTMNLQAQKLASRSKSNGSETQGIVQGQEAG